MKYISIFGCYSEIGTDKLILLLKKQYKIPIERQTLSIKTLIFSEKELRLLQLTEASEDGGNSC